MEQDYCGQRWLMGISIMTIMAVIQYWTRSYEKVMQEWFPYVLKL